ncbi:ABC transporter substrate-binding protein [Nocardioides psychrotolerans]|uniref:Multiple sugar transport system substrate-binding protein n=1 Tax=Nocardioides psychrotolerans TaxID=1005945 RepID=A0A1I3FZB4_9ACTN|nr:ABC transporter substrate-binding protein [Nocardioides psychrotolerans]GEP37388.1 ABC transporter substrate-binding protein [Nocardioides psychrotolerans]SFI16556.1 multiple sugar transport system substrate-binding protein [Nocardioides psychrotolerans]
MNQPRPGYQQIPASVLGMAASRRNVLRGGLLTGALLGSSTFLAACGGDSGGGDASGAVKFGMNEASGAGPAFDRLAQMAEAYAKKSGVKVDRNEVDHNTFQENINTYLQGNPDDVFTWFAGFRMNEFAEKGLISDVSDVWPIDGMADSFKTAATASDGKQYFVPKDYYPWAVFYKKSVFEKFGYVPPTDLAELMTLTKKMQGDDITPFAFADKDGWPAMGTFDILNMRINGFDFHMSLMAGDEEWDSAEVKQVFETWASLLPVHQADPLGRTWQEAATSMSKGECGMYLLGTFVVDAIPDDEDDLDFFTFPELDSSIGATALDAPIDGFCLSVAGKNQAGGKEMLKYLGTAEAADAGNKGTTPFIAANSNATTSGYSALQTKSAEVVGAAENIAQFLDRDTRADFATTVIIPSIQKFLDDPSDIDGVTKSIQEQKESIFV